MTSNVEARSLASLNLLAANPPRYPTNPTEAQHEPLVLYILRVPGSRDVILSPFKPQRKNVTGEDVANSLYYIHADNVSDLLLVAPGPIHNPGSPRSSQESVRSVNQIPRKPLPPGALVVTPKPTSADAVPDGGSTGVSMRSGPDNPPELPPKPVELPPRPPELPPRPPELPPRPPELPPRPPGHSPPLPAVSPPIRKPLGPRPMSSHGRLSEREPSPLSVSHDVSPPRTPAAGRPRSQGDRAADAGYADRLTRSPTHAGRSALFRQPSSSPNPFSLTLIRRDPVSGNQWNVGKITSPYGQKTPEQPTLQSMVEEEYPPQPMIHLHIDTPGYAKFRGLPSYQDVNLYHQKSVENASNFSLHADLTAADDGEGGFVRNLVMSYTKSWTAGLRQRFHGRSESPSSSPSRERAQQEWFQSRPATTSAPLPPRPMPQHHRQDSTNSMGSADSSSSSHDAGAGPSGKPSVAPLITQPGAGLKPRGYVFLSPWNGYCEFRTGNGGRSLKCRHALDGPSNQMYNPLVSSPQSKSGNRNRLAAGFSKDGVGVGSGGSDHGHHGEKPRVSELRFNLPSGELFGKSPTEDGREDGSSGRRRHHFHEHFNRMMRLDHGTDDDDGDSSGDEGHGGIMDIFDLTGLGKEKAGGGNRGKRAKLGKLIIYDEGIKMLDLVVAANMGVWWSVWERIF